MARITDIADAVAAEINALDTPPLGAVRYARVPEFALADMKTLHVTVVPKGWESQLASRSSSQFEYQIDVGVQKKWLTGDNAELDGLLALVERIADHFRAKRLTTMPAAMWVKAENTPLYSPEHMKDLRQFTSVLTLTFQVVR